MKLRGLLIIMCLAISMIPIGIIGGFQSFEFFTLFLIALIIAVTFIVSFIMSHFITRPLEKLTKNIDKISKGNLDVALEKSEIYEINHLTQSLNRVMTSLKLAINKVGVKKGEIFEETIKAKEEAEERYQDLLKNIDDWAWETDAKGKYVLCSEKIADALGYTPNEVIGKTIFELMPLEEAKKAKAVFTERCKKQEPIHQLENYYTHKDGHKVCIYTNAVPIFDKNGNFSGYRGIQRDITTNKQSQQTIEELIIKNKKLKEMRETKGDLIYKENHKNQNNTIKNIESENEFDLYFIFNEKAEIVDCNELMLDHLGYAKKEILKLSIKDIDALETEESIKKKIKEIKNQGTINVKTIHKRKDGSSVFVKEKIQYLKDKNIFKCIIKEEIK
jgi:PAS domain S-box-containing protein